ncbi:MAG: hypothetical protein AB7H97_01965 [Pseudobdellovibrionaceae bacterium]
MKSIFLGLLFAVSGVAHAQYFTWASNGLCYQQSGPPTLITSTQVGGPVYHMNCRGTVNSHFEYRGGVCTEFSGISRTSILSVPLANRVGVDSRLCDNQCVGGPNSDDSNLSTFYRYSSQHKAYVQPCF